MQGNRLLDQESEDPAPARQVADRAVRRLVDATGQELRQLAAALVEDAERRVARPGQLARGLEDAIEHQIEIELGQEAPPDLDEAGEAVVVAERLEHGRRRAARR